MTLHRALQRTPSSYPHCSEHYSNPEGCFDLHYQGTRRRWASRWMRRRRQGWMCRWCGGPGWRCGSCGARPRAAPKRAAAAAGRAAGGATRRSGAASRPPFPAAEVRLRFPGPVQRALRDWQRQRAARAAAAAACRGRACAAGPFAAAGPAAAVLAGGGAVACALRAQQQ